MKQAIPKSRARVESGSYWFGELARHLAANVAYDERTWPAEQHKWVKVDLIMGELGGEVS